MSGITRRVLARSWLLIVMVLAVGGFWRWSRIPAAPEVSHRLAEVVRQHPDAAVDIAQLVPFDWDRLYVFGP